MCGIYGCASSENKSYIHILEGLLRLQHRGQDSFGIASNNDIFKKMGLVKDIDHNHVKNIQGNFLVGHVRNIR